MDTNSTHRLRRHEVVVYALLWAVIFLAPAVSRLFETVSSGTDYSWDMPLRAWGDILPFFLLFWLHDCFVAPLLTRRRRHRAYAPCALALLLVFMLATCARQHNQPEPPAAQPALPHQPRAGETPPPPRPLDGAARPAYVSPADNDQPGPLMALISLALAVTLCGFNVAVKLYFKQQRDERDRELLSRQSLQHELDALKFQINPHFFMNTLNNIHALVDIDPERAKQAIIELSVLMRYVLYEGSQVRVPLAREIAFVDHYVALMRMRFTGKVVVEIHFPDQVPDVTIPPLIYATFVENAFKHGISYRHPSFVSVSVEVSDDSITFVCRNSIHRDTRPAPPVAPQSGPSSTATPPRRHGIGLENARKRLSLIYGTRYRLDITPTDGVYCVTLILPFDL